MCPVGQHAGAELGQYIIDIGVKKDIGLLAHGGMQAEDLLSFFLCFPVMLLACGLSAAGRGTVVGMTVLS